MNLGNGLSIPLQWYDRAVFTTYIDGEVTANFGGVVQEQLIYTVPSGKRAFVTIPTWCLTRFIAGGTEGPQLCGLKYTPSGMASNLITVFRGKIGNAAENYVQIPFNTTFLMLEGDSIHANSQNFDAASGQTVLFWAVQISEFTT